MAMADVFISYKSERRDVAHHLKDVLRRHGFSIWFDDALYSGRSFEDQIMGELQTAGCVVVLWCPKSMHSEWVLKEVAAAKEARKNLVEVWIGAGPFPTGFTGDHVISLSRWDCLPRAPVIYRIVQEIQAALGPENRRLPDEAALSEFQAIWERSGHKSLADLADHGEPVAVPAEPGVFSADEWLLTHVFAPIRADLCANFFGRSALFDQFKTWNASRSFERLLLVTGEPGAGKSAISAHFLDSRPCGEIVAYHFFHHDVSETLGLESVLANMAFMLCEALPAFAEAFQRKTCQDAFRLLKGKSEDGPATFLKEGIIEPLHAITAPPAPVWIVLDALDEAVGSDGGAERTTEAGLFDILDAALRKLPSWVRIFATCRGGALADRLGTIIDSNSRRLTLRFSLDARPPEEQASDLESYVRMRLDHCGLTLDPEFIKTVLRNVEGNFLHLKLLIDEIANGQTAFSTGTRSLQDSIARLPVGLNNYFDYNFRMLFPLSDNGGGASSDYIGIARPVLAILAASFMPVPVEWIAGMTGLERRVVEDMLVKLAPFLRDTDKSYSFSHKSVRDWLTDKNSSHAFCLDVAAGHRSIAAFCWTIFAERRRSGIMEHAHQKEWIYLLHHGVSHFISAARHDHAVILANYIYSRWDENKITRLGIKAFIDINPDRYRRVTLKALEIYEPHADDSEFTEAVINLVLSFYQVEPLNAPLRLVIERYRRVAKSDDPELAKWDAILNRLLSADNYVLRYVLSDVLAASLENDDPPVSVAVIETYLDHPDINRRELAAYTFCNLYGRDADRIDGRILERLATSPDYGPRSALGGLLLNICHAQEGGRPRIDSGPFWQPLWEHNRLDIWDLQAARAFYRGETAIADPDAMTALQDLLSTEALRSNLAQRDGIAGIDDIGQADKFKFKMLITGFYQLGQDPEGSFTGVEHALLTSPYLQEIMRLIFSHPLWSVAEMGASILADLAKEGTAKKAIVQACLLDANWRVRFGAVETAYLSAGADGIGLFDEVVRKLFDDPNARVRALCAENLIAYLLDRPVRRRAQLLADSEYGKIMARWVADDDCWVLEHIFRLFKWDDREGGACCEMFLGMGRSNLLEGLPLNNWRNLERETFLSHIEQRRRAQVVSSEPKLAS
jgi:TIR domain